MEVLVMAHYGCRISKADPLTQLSKLSCLGNLDKGLFLLTIVIMIHLLKLKSHSLVLYNLTPLTLECEQLIFTHSYMEYPYYISLLGGSIISCWIRYRYLVFAVSFFQLLSHTK